MSLTPGARLGPYEILAPLGAGGMGEVYRARDTKLNRDVAIKILPDALASDPAARARFEREAQAVAALSHPNILGIFDFGVERQVPFAVMELLDGGTLREHLHDGAIAPRKAIEYAQQIAAGLGAAHARGITHRDLKPENVFVTQDGRIKILDFGLAKMGPGTTADAPTPSMMTTSPALTGAGTIVGTVGYMSPEQVRGREVDQRSDIFSFGAILYEILSGKRAFTGDSAVETMNAILKEEPAELTRTNAALPPALDRIVRRCLEKSPDERFQSARDVAFAIDAISTTRSDAATPAVQSAGLTRTRKTRVWLAAAGAVITIAIGVGAFVAGSMRAPTSAPRLTRLTFDRGTVRSARFAPDGRTVVYGATWHGQPIRIFQTRLGSPESIPLQLPDADVLAVAPSGEMAVSIGRRFIVGWINSGTLARAPLVGGSPREIVEAISGADWSPKGDELAVVRRVDGKDRLEYPIGKVLYETTGYVSHARVSPSGDAIAFLDHPIYGDNRGWVSLISTSRDRKRLTKEWSAAEGLAWSSDGREIWYTAGDGRSTLHGVTLAGVDREIWAAPADLAILDASSDGRVLLTANSLYADVKWLGPGDTPERDISWFGWAVAEDISPDGRVVLFARFDEGAGLDYQIGLRRIDASSTVLLGAGLGVSLSPDSRWALGITYSQPGIFMVPTGPGERRTLTTSGFRYITAGWLPDGKRILLIAEHDNEPAAAYVQDLAGGGPRKVPSRIPLSRVDYGPKVSPDSKWFFSSWASGPPVIVPLEGGEPRTMSGLTENDVLKAWTADGRGLIVWRRSPDWLTYAIMRSDLETGRLETLRTVRIGDSSGIRGLGLVTTPDGRTVVHSVTRYLTDLYLVEGLK